MSSAPAAVSTIVRFLHITARKQSFGTGSIFAVAIFIIATEMALTSVQEKDLEEITMFAAKLAIMPGAFFIGAAVLAQTPSAPPTGMTLQQFLSIARGRIMDRDADGDGRISAAEFAAGAGAHPHAKAQATNGAPAAGAPGPAGDGPMAGMMNSRMFQRLDTNSDGYLDKAEIDAMLTKRFERMDANHDGIVTAAERQAARGAMRGRNGADE